MLKEKNKLIALLKACKKEELARLRHFVASPYFNRQTALCDILAYLLKLWPEMNDAALNKTAIYKAAYPEQDFDEKNYRYLSSNLGRLIEQFWAIERWQQTTNQQQLHTMAVAVERGVEKTYRKINRNLEEQLDKKDQRSEGAILLEKLFWTENLEKQFEHSRERRYDDNIQHTSDFLDRYYFLEKLIAVCTMLDRKNIVAGEYTPRLSDAWASHLVQQEYFREPIIKMYYSAWMTLHEEDNEAHFWTVRQILNTPSEKIPTTDLRTVYLMLINYCARKIRQGKEDFVAEALGLYQTGLEHQILLVNGELSPWAFTNIVKLAMRLHRYEWGESFIRTAAPLLPPQFRENALHYNLSELFYYTHRYDEALVHLNQVAFSDLNYYLGARVLLAKVYYEQKEQDALRSLMASFIIFLKRNKAISTAIKQTYLNFCDILLLLVKNKRPQIQGLNHKISTTSLLTDRQWLLEQWRQLTKP